MVINDFRLFLWIGFILTMTFGIYASLSERVKDRRLRLPEGSYNEPLSEEQFRQEQVTTTPSSRPTAHLLSPRFEHIIPHPQHAEGSGSGSGSYFPVPNAGTPSPTTPRSPYTNSAMTRDSSSRPFLVRHVPHSPPAQSELVSRQRSHSHSRSFGHIHHRAVPRSLPAYQQSPPLIVPKKEIGRLSPIPQDMRPEPPYSAPEVATTSRTMTQKHITCPICMLTFGRVELLQAHLDVHK